MALGPSYTGATLEAQLFDDALATVGSAITTGFSESAGGKGLFKFIVTIPDGHTGWLDVYVSGASSDVIASLPINPIEIEPAATKTQLVEALATDTYAEVSTVPAATSTLKDKLNWLFALARNPIIQTTSEQTLRNYSDSTDIATAAVSDDGTTFIRDAWS